MPLSKKKQEKAARKKRVEYVKSCSYSGREFAPFIEHNWDTAARKYIETGDESLKSQFPGPRQEQSK